MKHPLVRVYFNKGGPLPWSVDTGPGTEESNAVGIVMLGCGKTVFDPQAGDNVKTPTAWIEFENMFITTQCGVIVISKIPDWSAQ